MVHELVVAREKDIKTRSRPTLNNAVLCQRTSKHWYWNGLSGDHYARLPSNNLSQTANELWKPKENSGRQQLSGAPHATHAKSVDKHVRRELDCTPTLARINTDYDPGSVGSTAQSNNSIYCESKKQDTKLLSISSPNINRFSNFFSVTNSAVNLLQICV